MGKNDFSTTLFTGGSGLLGRTVASIAPGMIMPKSLEFDVSDYSMMKSYVEGREIDTIVHAAAFTSPPKIDKDPEKALTVNIIGAANVVKLCIEKGWRLIYISTDYVFKGDVGNYKEDDPVFPVNKYAWSKLGGECAVRLYERSLVVRTSFGPEEFPYEKAFVDQWTSRESVSVIAKKLLSLINSTLTGVVHVGGARRTVYDYAVSTAQGKDIGRLSTKEVNFTVPKDTSLDCSKYVQHVLPQGEAK